MPRPAPSRWIICTGDSLYGALPRFSRELAIGLADIGKKPEIWDLTAPDALARLGGLVAEPAEAFVGFNAVGLPGPMFERIGAPYVGLLLDHPLYLTGRLRRAFPGYQVTCIDRSHVEFVRRRYPGVPATFWPHGACQPADPEPPARDIDILFTGRYDDPDRLAAGWSAGSAGTVALFETIVQANLRHPEVGFYQHVLECCGRAGLPPEFVDDEDVLSEFAKADRFLHAFWRREFLLALDRAGLSVQVFGEGWQEFRSPTRHRFHAAVSFDEAVALTQRAKIALSIGAHYGQGSHERVLTAMLCGAVAVTEESTFYREMFQSGRDLVTFDSNDLERVIGEIRTLLVDDERRRGIGQAGQRAVRAGHTWRDRARELVALQPSVGATRPV